MIKRIELTNFMSHEHTVIEPATGLTVLVGPNNCGKSAVVAALQILCRNDNSTYVLRHGEKECSVKIETDDGHSIEWKRRNSPSYVINGKLFDRLGRNSVPEELHAALRMPRVDASDDADFDVHFGAQKSPIFLLGSSPANAARFFASSSDAIRLVQMQKRHKDKLQEAQREKNRLEAESRQLVAELDLLSPVVEIDRHLNDLDADYRKLLCQEADCRNLASTSATLAAQERAVCQVAAEAAAMALLAPPASQWPTDDLAELIEEAQQYGSAVAAASGSVTALAPLPAPPVLGDTAFLETLSGQIASLNKQVNANLDQQLLLRPLVTPPAQENTAELAVAIKQLEAANLAVQEATQRRDLLRAVHFPPSLQDESPLRRTVDSLVAAAVETQHHQQQLVAVSSISIPPATIDPSHITGLVSQLVAAVRQCNDCAVEFDRAEIARAEAEQNLRQEAAENICPVCGGPLDADRLLTGFALREGHDHD